MNQSQDLVNTNPIAYKLINNAISAQKLTHAYLFSAPRHYEISAEPEYLVKALLNSSAPTNLASYLDLISIDGVANGITKEEIISAIDRLSQTALGQAQKKFLIIKNIERANVYSLNALLKFIEEPTPETYIILTTNQLSQVLSTVKSRTQIINLRAMPKAQLIEALAAQKVSTHHGAVLSLITSSLPAALKLNQNATFWTEYASLLTTLEALQRRPVKTMSDLGPLIRKDNVFNMRQLLSGFVNDIWKTAANITPTLHEAKRALGHYVANNFNYVLALNALNEFALSLDRNVNFDLAKNELLIKWEKCYG